MSTIGNRPGKQTQPVDGEQQPAQPAGQGWQPSGFGQPTAPQRKPGLWTRFKNRTFSDLNLNGHTPPRVQPEIGEWGPEKVPTTKQKKRMRIYVSIALPAIMLACFLLGWYVYYLMTGCFGFGLGCSSR